LLRISFLFHASKYTTGFRMKRSGSAMTASGQGYPVIVKSKFAGFNRLPATAKPI
jgi:hypothetical protein